MYRQLVSQLKASQLLYLDEASIDPVEMVRTHGRGRGRRVHAFQEMRRGQRPHSVIAFLSITGFVGCAISRPQRGGLNRAAFIADFEAHACPLIQQYPGPHSVVLLDNSILHYAPELEALVNARGGTLLKLNACGYEDMPVEKAFSKTRAYLRRHRKDPHLRANPRLATRRAIHSATPAGATSYFECPGVRLADLSLGSSSGVTIDLPLLFAPSTFISC